MQPVNSFISMFLSFCMCAGFFGFLQEWGLPRLIGFFLVWMSVSVLTLLLWQFFYGIILCFEWANRYEQYGELEDDSDE